MNVYERNAIPRSVSPSDKVLVPVFDYEDLMRLEGYGWSNSSCLGYMIMGMEAAKIKPEQIQAAITAMHSIFDMRSLQDAEIHYQNSDY